MGHYSRVPKDYHENLLFRRWLLAKAKAKNGKATQVSLWDACKKDILFYCNSFGWTYDPREPMTAIPFITYPFQDDALLTILDCIHGGKKLVMRKSRDMGASWMTVFAMDHQATFERYKRFVMMSYVADLVDKRGNPKSLFWKLDFIHKWLPTWLCPTINKRLLGREYISSGSTVDGVTTTLNSNVGDRATAIFVDELSKYEASDADAMLSALPDVSRSIIYNFTRNTTMGRSHPSHQLVEQVKRGDIDGLEMHWTQHPVKAVGLYRVPKGSNKVEIHDKAYQFPGDYKFQTDGRFEWHSVWFDRERKERGNDRYVSEQLEIEDEGSSYTIYDPDIIREYISQHCRPPVVEGDIVYDSNTGKADFFSVVTGGIIKLWCKLDSLGRLPQVQYVTGTDISLGLGTTNSCFCAARTDTGEKVLEFVTPFMKPDDFATKCIAICNWLSSPGHKTLLCWEGQGPGETFAARVVELNYSNVYFPVSKHDFIQREQKKPGWFPSTRTKADLHARYRSGLAKRDYLNPSRLAMEETLQWIESPLGKGPVHNAAMGKTKDPSGARDNHGDRVVMDALCYKMMENYAAGGGAVKAREPKALPGTFAWVLAQDQRDANNQDIYPERRRR